MKSRNQREGWYAGKTKGYHLRTSENYRWIQPPHHHAAFDKSIRKFVNQVRKEFGFPLIPNRTLLTDAA